MKDHTQFNFFLEDVQYSQVDEAQAYHKGAYGYVYAVDDSEDEYMVLRHPWSGLPHLPYRIEGTVDAEFEHQLDVPIGQHLIPLDGSVAPLHSLFESAHVHNLSVIPLPGEVASQKLHGVMGVSISTFILFIFALVLHLL